MEKDMNSENPTKRAVDKENWSVGPSISRVKSMHKNAE